MSAATSSRSCATWSRSPSPRAKERRKEVEANAQAAAEERVLNALVGATRSRPPARSFRKKLQGRGARRQGNRCRGADTASPRRFDIPGQPGAQRRRGLSATSSARVSAAHQARAHHGEGGLRSAGRGGIRQAARQDQVMREALRAAEKTASSSSTRSTRSPPAPNAAAPTCRAKACSAICCR